MQDLEDRLLLAGDWPVISVEGARGFVVSSHEFDEAVHLHDAGDLNGDDLDDLVINGEFNPEQSDVHGAAYVVFGRPEPPDGNVISGQQLDGVNGFVLPGYGVTGHSESEIARLGDVNGDGIDDLALIRRENLEFFAPINVDILFGSREPFDAVVDLPSLVGDTRFGYSIQAANPAHLAGGDVNGDGLSDILIGSVDLPHTFVVFGSGAFGAPLDVADLDGEGGFKVRLGKHRLNSTGDINGDDIADLLVASETSDEAYVVFGSSDPFPREIHADELDGDNGFVVHSPDLTEIVALGDVNADGVGDFALAGHLDYVQVVFGSKNGFPPELHVRSLDVSEGIRIEGFRRMLTKHQHPTVAGPGDVNGDGVADILVGNHEYFDGTVGDFRGEV